MNVFLSISFNICCGCSKEPFVVGSQKNRLIETALLSTHNMLFFFDYTLLSRGLKGNIL